MKKATSTDRTKAKRVIKTPYHHLAEDFDNFKRKVRFPRTVSMWHYPKGKLTEGWNLLDLYERTKAADQLGYEVVLVAADEGLKVQYVAKRPT